MPATPLTVRAGRIATVKLSKASVAYGQLCQEHFLPMAALQSGVLRGGADVVGGIGLHQGGFEHALAMATLGAAVSGWGNALWLRVLEGRYGADTTPDVVLRKTATDYILWAPLANSAYLFGLPLLTGKGAEAALASWQCGFASVMLLELAIFMPYNLIAFERLPLSLRPLTGAVLAALFTIGVGTLA